MNQFADQRISIWRANDVAHEDERYAEEHGLPITQVLPDWKRFARSAGRRRNEEMVNYADAAIVIWDGSSRGARHLISTANADSLPCYVTKVSMM